MFPTRSETNRAVQPKKIVWRSKFRFQFLNKIEENLYYLCNKHKYAGQLCCYRSADLHLCFLHISPFICPFFFLSNNFFSLLAHLSRRLVGELIVYPWSCVRPSSGVRRPSSSVVVHNFKHEYLCNQWADRNQILSEASLGRGKGCIRF